MNLPALAAKRLNHAQSSTYGTIISVGLNIVVKSAEREKEQKRSASTTKIIKNFILIGAKSGNTKIESAGILTVLSIENPMVFPTEHPKIGLIEPKEGP